MKTNLALVALVTAFSRQPSTSLHMPPRTIDAANKYAYGLNFGWLDCRGDTNSGSVIGEYICSGHIYSANVGWMDFSGQRRPTNGIHYQNVSTNDFGVNQDGLGNLRGYAYGANIGWINFENTGAPKVDLLTGNLSGYVWSANCGWISLNAAFAYVQTDTIQKGTLAPDGLPIAWLLMNFGTTNVDANADPDHDGMSNMQEYLTDTDPNNVNDYLQITGGNFSSGGTSAALTWNSVATRYYLIQKTPSLISPVWTDSGLGIITPACASTTQSFTDTSCAAMCRFYIASRRFARLHRERSTISTT